MRRGKRATLACTAVVIALLVFGVAACTSESTESTTTDGGPLTTGGTPGEGTSGAGAPSEEPIPTTTTIPGPGAQSPLLHTITVSGTGHMSARPDEAVITVGVEETAATAAAALDANSKKMEAVLARLKAKGIADSAIETANVSVYRYPIFDPKTGRQTGTSYQANNSVAVTLIEFDTIGDVFAAATEAGANNLYGPTWQLSDNTKAQAEALAQASAQARAKAEAFAIANRVTLGEVLVLTEGYSSPAYYYDYRAGGEFTTTTAAAGIAPPPISPQNLDIYVTATITYELRR